MSNYHKVVMFPVSMFEGYEHFVTPRAISDEEIARRRSREPGTVGRESEHKALLRAVAFLKKLPITDLKAHRVATDVLSNMLIGSAAQGLFPEETMGVAPDSRDARGYKPVWLENLTSPDPSDPEQRPTGIEVLDRNVTRLEQAAAVAGRLVTPSGMTDEEVRDLTIKLARLEGRIGIGLSAYPIADAISYEGVGLTNFDVMHLVRERALRQQVKAIELTEQLGVIPTIRHFAHDYSPSVVHLEAAGLPAVSAGLQLTADLAMSR